ncbi:MAG: polyribonucleotide nucleotidyltransferase [Candidatus Omnitrophota bacterium]|nr:polyribonucleotide nucleotidyltransferase [Candidatus Omnitrophota bacterium]
MSEKVALKIGNQDLIIETGKMANSADGAVTVQCGGTVVLVTVVVSKKAKESVSFLPLSVDYREKTYAAGKIPGGFFKREGRPSEKEILSSRLIDRPIRALFSKGFANEIQIIATVLSADEQNDSDCLALVGASAALAVSDVPFPELIGTVRIGRVEDEFIVNPTFSELEKSSLNLIVAGTRQGVTMLEGGAEECDEKTVLGAIEFGYQSLIKIIELQEKLAESSGKPKREIELKKMDEKLCQQVEELSRQKLDEVIKLDLKEQREEALKLLCDELTEKLVTEDSEWSKDDIKNVLEEIECKKVRQMIVGQGVRVGSRDYKTIRSIDCEVGVLPRTHGSAIFTRGQTQSLATATLGSRMDEQMIDGLGSVFYKRFMLHYNFPPFSVGEVRPMRGTGRREIGHGALSEKAMKPVMPSEDDFPYTVRLVSDILESNGSSSMASVCGASLAMMDAGIPIKAQVAGIAMGLIKQDGKEVLLTDIIGLEDHFGDMDFKVAGTAKGITVLQLDIKINGVSSGLLARAMEDAKDARMFILEKMNKVLAKPRGSLSSYAPRIITLKVNPSKVGDVIGPGGKIIRKIQDDTGAKIEIEDGGKINIVSTNEEASKKAIDIIKGLVEEVEVGKIYSAKVEKITNFGAFCEILPGQSGLIHVSELDKEYVRKVEDVLKEGEKVSVKVIGIDERGRINLSRKQALEEQEKK